MTDKTTGKLNELLRGELSAIETYLQAINGVESNNVHVLKQIKEEHINSANMLRQHIHQLGGEPDQGSGVWGAFAKAVEGTATALGSKAALQALKYGEETGIKSYENALKETLPMECQQMIESRLLPQTRNHVELLERMITTV
jgi:uncharacterized protein (TIGR02284 family)